MDIELALCMNVKDNKWFMEAASKLLCNTSRWETKLQVFLDALMENGGLEGFESYEHSRTVIAYPHNTRRVYPAFIAVSPGHSGKYPNAVYSRYTGVCTIEVVEAGNYAMAGGSEAPKTWRAKESSALWH